MKKTNCWFAPAKEKSSRDERISSIAICELESADGSQVYLLVRYFDLLRVDVEGDHLYTEIDDAKKDALAEFGIRFDDWVLLADQEASKVVSGIRGP